MLKKIKNKKWKKKKKVAEGNMEFRSIDVKDPFAEFSSLSNLVGRIITRSHWAREVHLSAKL